MDLTGNETGPPLLNRGFSRCHILMPILRTNSRGTDSHKLQVAFSQHR